jgi:glycosyltransferase involved in cell wall biosynthesis
MKFSVAMCTYNGAAHLREQLESIAAQTRAPDELVVCDDASRDETTEIVREFSARASFPVRLQVNATNVGTTKNFEQAIRLCAGDLVALSDQDDVWEASKLARFEAVFAASPDVGLVFSDAELVSEDLQPLGCRLWERVGFDEGKRKLITRGRAVEVLLLGWLVTGATMALRARDRELALPIPTDLPMIHDGWLALMAATVARVAFIEEPLVKYRQHARQQIGAPEKKSAGDSDAGLDAHAVRVALRRANPYAEQMAIIAAVRRRLETQGAYFDASRALSTLDSLAAHLDARARLPRSLLARALWVLRELLTLRYHRHSKGIRSAAKDLLARGARGDAPASL